MYNSTQPDREEGAPRAVSANVSVIANSRSICGGMGVLANDRTTPRFEEPRLNASKRIVG
jgi:hypothetical protein